MVGYGLWLRSKSSRDIDYDHIERDFPDLVRFLGLDAPAAQVTAALANPITKKLDAIPEAKVPNFDVMRPLAAQLFTNLKQCMRERAPWKRLMALQRQTMAGYDQQAEPARPG